MTAACIALSAVGLIFSFASAGWWSWATALVTLCLFSSIPCISPASARIVAAVASPFSFLTFILQVTASSIILSHGSRIFCANYYGDDYYYYSSYDSTCEAVSKALGAIGIIGSALWLAAAIIGAVIAYKISTTLGSTNDCCGGGNTSNTHVAGTPEKLAEDTEKQEVDIEVANAFPVTSSPTSSTRIVEKIQADGSKVVEKTVIDESGNKTVTVTVLEGV